MKNKLQTLAATARVLSRNDLKEIKGGESLFGTACDGTQFCEVDDDCPFTCFCPTGVCVPLASTTSI